MEWTATHILKHGPPDAREAVLVDVREDEAWTKGAVVIGVEADFRLRAGEWTHWDMPLEGVELTRLRNLKPTKP